MNKLYRYENYTELGNRHIIVNPTSKSNEIMDKTYLFETKNQKVHVFLNSYGDPFTETINLIEYYRGTDTKITIHIPKVTKDLSILLTQKLLAGKSGPMNEDPSPDINPEYDLQPLPNVKILNFTKPIIFTQTYGSDQLLTNRKETLVVQLLKNGGIEMFVKTKSFSAPVRDYWTNDDHKGRAFKTKIESDYPEVFKTQIIHNWKIAFPRIAKAFQTDEEIWDWITNGGVQYE